MKTLVTFSKPRYIDIEEAGVTICTMDVSLNLDKHPAWGYIDTELIRDRFDLGYLGDFEVKAKARVHPDDKYSPKLGRKIAEARCKKKAFDKASRVYAYQAGVIAKAYKEIASSSKACFDCEMIEDSHLDVLLNS